jgi:hypothetical protein
VGVSVPLSCATREVSGSSPPCLAPGRRRPGSLTSRTRTRVVTACARGRPAGGRRLNCGRQLLTRSCDSLDHQRESGDFFFFCRKSFQPYLQRWLVNLWRHGSTVRVCRPSTVPCPRERSVTGRGSTLQHRTVCMYLRVTRPDASVVDPAIA